LITLNLLTQSVHGPDRSKILRKIEIPCKYYFLTVTLFFLKIIHCPEKGRPYNSVSPTHKEKFIVTLKRPFFLPNVPVARVLFNSIVPRPPWFSVTTFCITSQYFSLHSSSLKMEVSCSSEILVSPYKTTQCHKSEHYALKNDLSLMTNIRVHGPQ
jgi:hypothetical protein